MKLTKQVAFVTGAGRGIGRHIALSLAAHGAQVVLTARTPHEIEAVAAEIRAMGGDALAIPLDISDPNAVDATISQTRATFGTVDILINNAATVDPVGGVADVERGAWVKAQQVNLFGAFYTLHAVLPDMLKKGYGRIVNLTSAAGRGAGIARFNAYSVSKAGLDMLMRNTAQDLHGTNITINNYSPGSVDTPMQSYVRNQSPELVGEVGAFFQKLHADGKLNRPEDSARHVLALVLSELNGELVQVQALPPSVQAILDTL